MTERLRDFVDELARDLGTPFVLRPPSGRPLGDLPEPLRGLYSFCDGGDLGFGVVLRRREVDGFSSSPPIHPEWTCFGTDGLGVRWLCANRDRSGLWFTTWDHEVEPDVEGPVAADLVEFLEGAFESALEGREGGEGNALVLEAVPGSARGKVAMALKRLTGASTGQALERLNELPVEIEVSSPSEARRIARDLRELGVDCALRLDFL